MGSDRTIYKWNIELVQYLRIGRCGGIFYTFSYIYMVTMVYVRSLVMTEKQSSIMGAIMSFLLIFAMLLVAKESAELVKVWNQQEKQEKVTTVVIDAGHGGIDPGKVGVNDALEKDINLSIALKLKKYLEQQDIRVVMTRETDEGLYEESDSNKKVRDMKNRLAIMEKTAPALTISIHQNSYPEESVSGMQVFYYETSTEGKALAEIMQQTMIESLKPQKERTAKANDTYYLLKKTTVPIVIVECGFLSNRAEAELLVSSDYQEKMAWAIHMGVLRYLNQSEQ